MVHAYTKTRVVVYELVKMKRGAILNPVTSVMWAGDMMMIEVVPK